MTKRTKQGLQIAFAMAGFLLWSVAPTSAQRLLPEDTPPRIIILDCGGDFVDADLGAKMEQRLTARGFDVTRKDLQQAFKDALNPVVDYELVVLCGPQRVPFQLSKIIKRYLSLKGRVVALGGPFFEEFLWERDGEWLTWEAYGNRIANSLADQYQPTMLYDFEETDPAAWSRGTGDSEAPVTVQRAAEGVHGSKGAFYMSTPKIPDWETRGAPDLEKPFPAGHTITTFWAKGNANTPKMALEWTEADGSRWYAKVDLGREWRFYALPPSAFTYWPDNPSQGRGGAGDSFKPENARRLTLGLAFLWDDGPMQGPHEFWVDSIGVAPPVPGLQDADALIGSRPRELDIEGLGPAYKFYPVTNLHHLWIAPDQYLIPQDAMDALNEPIAAPTLSYVARPGGDGFGKEKNYRFVSLLDCIEGRDRRVGSAAYLMIYRYGGMVAGAPILDKAFWRIPEVLDHTSELIERMLTDVFLLEGGATQYAALPNDEVGMGLTLYNASNKQSDVQSIVWARDRNGLNALAHESLVELEPGQIVTVDVKTRLKFGQINDEPPYRLQAYVTNKQGRGDELIHSLRVWEPKPVDERRYVEARDGGFWLDGKPWYPHGINYMPSSGIGLDDWRTFEHWMGATGYDPRVIDRDLDDIVAMGMNMVSVFIYHDDVATMNLLDFLMRCEDRGLKVNLSMRPGTPIDFQWDKMKEIVERHRLDENDTVFAYDLAWEPRWQGQGARARHDGEWRQWIEKTYGSLEKAESAWNHAAPRSNGEVTNPPDAWIRDDGPWRALVVDYHRFLNDLLKQRYGRARDLMKSIAPRQLVSFRMSMAGDPTFPPEQMCYDLAGLAEAVDIMEPEAYGRLGDWEQVKPGWFTTAYARAVAPELPVLWAEFGMSVWDQRRMIPSPGLLTNQARFYEDFYRMAWESGANGTVCWWFPGGFRTGENSDYGIINPDRSWRPVSHVIRRWADRFTTPRPIPQPDIWIEFDRAKHVDALFGIYQAHQKPFWGAIEKGQFPGLREVKGAK